MASLHLHRARDIFDIIIFDISFLDTSSEVRLSSVCELCSGWLTDILIRIFASRIIALAWPHRHLFHRIPILLDMP